VAGELRYFIWQAVAPGRLDGEKRDKSVPGVAQGGGRSLGLVCYVSNLF